MLLSFRKISFVLFLPSNVEFSVTSRRIFVLHFVECPRLLARLEETCARDGSSGKTCSKSLSFLLSLL